MGVLLPAACAANLARSVLGWRRRGRPGLLPAVALAGQVAALAVTATVELPINATVLTWSPADPPDDWRRHRDRWARFHLLRTVCATVGQLALVADATRPRSAPAPQNG